MNRRRASDEWLGLWQVRGFRAVLAAHTLSLLGSMISQVAIVTLVFHRTGSTLVAAATFGVALVPHAVVGVFFAGAADRWSRRGVLVGCELGAAALTVAIALLTMPWPLLMSAVAAVSTLVAVFGATRAAVLPELVSTRLFPAARAALRIASQLAQIGGYAVGGVVLVLASVRTALLLDAATFVASAVILRLGTPALAPGPRAPVSATTPLAGLRLVMRTPQVPRLLVLSWLPAAVVVTPEALAAPYAAMTGHSGSGVGLILTAVAVGASAGEVIGVRLLARTTVAKVERMLIITALPLLGFAATPPIAVATVLAGLSAIGLGGVVAIDRQLVAGIDAGLRRRVLATSVSGLMLGQASMAIAAGAAAEFVPPAVVITFAGGAGVVAFPLLVRRSDTQSAG